MAKTKNYKIPKAARTEREPFGAALFACRLRKHVKWIVAGVMFATFMWQYLMNYSYVITFHEQHHLFLFSKDYIAQAQHNNGYWWPWMEFIVQFGYYPWLGALVWSLMFVGVYLMTYSIIRHLTGLRDLIGISCILPCWMFFQTVDVDIIPVELPKVFVIIFCVWVPVFAFGRFIPKRFKCVDAGKNILLSAPFWCWALVGAFFLPFAFRMLGAGGHYAAELRFILLGAGMLGVLTIVPMLDKESPMRVWITRILVTLVALGGFTAVFIFWQRDYYRPRSFESPGGKMLSLSREDVMRWRKNERQMIEADQALRRGDWDTVLKISNDVLSQGSNHLMFYFRSLALYHRGELTTRLFDIPQRFSNESLYFPWHADRNQAEYGAYVYEHMGALNSAIHWEFEAMVGWGETADHLRRLAAYYIEAGKPKIARKFIYPLKQSLFYRRDAERLEELLRRGDVPGIRDAVAHVPDSVHRWDAVDNIGLDAFFILKNDPGNRMALEYTLMSLLLTNHVGDFYQVMRKYWPKDEPLPRYFWEALCLMRMQTGAERLAEQGYVIPADVDLDFRAFLATQRNGQKAVFSPAQKQTYWYYAAKVSKYAPTILIDEQEFNDTPTISNH